LDDTLFSSLVEIYKSIKDDSSVTEHTSADIIPLLSWHSGDRATVIGLAGLDTSYLEDLVLTLRDTLPKPDFLVFSVDSYYETIEKNQPIPVRGSLAKRFELGDKSVCESLMILAVGPDNIKTSFLPYRWNTQTNVIDWLEPQDSPCVDGLVYDSLSKAFMV